MRIGELAAAAHTPVDTVRHYEKTGLLPPPPRQSNGYRFYGPEHLQRLAFIRRCRLLGLGLEDIRRLLQAVADPGADCAAVDALIAAHQQTVREQLVALQSLERELAELRRRCGGQPPRDVAHCGVLSALDCQPVTPHADIKKAVNGV